MRKIIRSIGIIIFLGVISLIIIGIYNPFNLRTQIISKILNYYLSNNVEGYKPLETGLDTSQNTSSTGNVSVIIDKNPLLNAEQEKTLENLGVDVTKLPTVINSEMQTCFFEKMGEERAAELIKGATPGASDLLKVKDCLNN